MSVAIYTIVAGLYAGMAWILARAKKPKVEILWPLVKVLFLLVTIEVLGWIVVGKPLWLVITISIATSLIGMACMIAGGAFVARKSIMNPHRANKETKVRRNISLFSVAFALACITAPQTHAGPLEEDFRNPADAARPFAWWHWMGPYFSKDGITKDLEAMKASGIGGATIFNVSSYLLQGPLKESDPWSVNTYRGPAYWDALRHAAAEADRLGLELGIHNCVGYATTGGPWIDEERSMQRLVWSTVEVDGGGRVEINLPQPDLDPGKGWGITKEKLSFFRDVAVLAVPADRDTLDPGDVKDVSTHFDSTGRLLWDAPAGKWTVYRIGHASNGHYPFPEPEDTSGRTFEVDKMSIEQSRHHWRNVIDPIKEHLGPLMGRSFKHVLIDSYESGMQNWTPGFREEFKARKGYDLLPWLATMTPTVRNSREAGKPLRIIGSADMTARFEWDYKDVIATLYHEHGWKVGAEMANAAGAQLHWEAYGGPFDTVEGSALADVPMGCFWTHGPKSGVNQTIVAAARAGNRNIIGVEAYTGMPELSNWTETLAFLKMGADCAYSMGGNRFMLHHWVHQPFDDRYQPGMGMHAWGTHFGRHQTWLMQGQEFYRYLARVQALLQRGETPIHFVSVGTMVPGSDVISRRALLNDVRVEDGRIVLPSGRRYAFLHVPHAGALLPEEVRRIKSLLQEGATVSAAKPARSPSLAGYPQCDGEVAALAAEIWGESNEAVRKSGQGTLYAKGHFNAALKDLKLEPAFRIASADAGDIRINHRKDGNTDWFFVANVNERPVNLTLSFAVQGMQPELWDAENGSMRDAPLWRYRDGRTEVTVSLGAVKSVFVVFRKITAEQSGRLASVEASGGYELLTDEQGAPVIRAKGPLAGTAVLASGERIPFDLQPSPERLVAGPWQVDLVPKLGPSSKIGMPSLRSLTEHDDPAVKYFSGTATYRGNVSIDAALVGKDRRVQLDLGDVRDMVRVKVNGTEIAVLWHPPFVCDITTALKPGDNTLELDVANTWHNRLVGDAQFPKDMSFWGEVSPWFLKNEPRPQPGRVAFTTTDYQKKDSPLIPAGLLGPVRLIPQAETNLTNINENAQQQ
jgi:hypothetical protein